MHGPALMRMQHITYILSNQKSEAGAVSVQGSAQGLVQGNIFMFSPCMACIYHPPRHHQSDIICTCCSALFRPIERDAS